MNIEQLREICLSFPHVTEDVKWGNDLCFCVGKKMFAVTGLESNDPAPYVARYHWVAIEKPDTLAESELKDLISNSYQMVFEKLPPKTRKSLADR